MIALLLAASLTVGVDVFECPSILNEEMVASGPAITAPFSDFTEAQCSTGAVSTAGAIVMVDNPLIVTATITASGIQLTPGKVNGYTVVRYILPSTGELGQVNAVVSNP